MSNVVSKEVRLKARPEGMPKLEDFEVAETEIGAPGDGEVLIRNIWMSVDPYMRGRMYDRESYVPPFQIGAPLEGGAIGQVVASNSDKVAVGDYVQSMLGWREYAVTLGDIETRVGTRIAAGAPGLWSWLHGEIKGWFG